MEEREKIACRPKIYGSSVRVSGAGGLPVPLYKLGGGENTSLWTWQG